MSGFTKLMLLGLFGSMIVIPTVAARNGWGLPTEKNAKIIQQSKRYCPESARDKNGNCPRSYRSTYYGRSGLGGGIGSGK